MITQTKDLNKCYGCFACANVCPKNCITLEQNDEGFFMPVVDTEKCINCGLCDKVCIIDKKENNITTKRYKLPLCYYGYLNDDDLRRRSASGGLSYALSCQTINEGGVSFGVVGKWFGDVHHISAEKLEDLDEICMSKNIQSRVGNSYAQAKRLLQNGTKVLFTGTPCQIAALYSYLGKDYDNLLTADLVCHGVPSQKVLKAYIKTLEKEDNDTIIKFGRNNKNQYLPVQYIAEYQSREDRILMPEDSFYRKAFLSNLIQRKSCAGCSFSRIPRTADITMGDVMFSVGNKKHSDIDPKNLGVSLILVNSEKGSIALEKIKPHFTYKKMYYDEAESGNRWVSHGIEVNPLREKFFQKFLSSDFESTTEIIQKSYQNMREKYIKEGKTSRLKILLNPKKLLRKISCKLKRKLCREE